MGIDQFKPGLAGNCAYGAFAYSLAAALQQSETVRFEAALLGELTAAAAFSDDGWNTKQHADPSGMEFQPDEARRKIVQMIVGEENADLWGQDSFIRTYANDARPDRLCDGVTLAVSQWNWGLNGAPDAKFVGAVESAAEICVTLARSLARHAKASSEQSEHLALDARAGGTILAVNWLHEVWQKRFFATAKPSPKHSQVLTAVPVMMKSFLEASMGEVQARVAASSADDVCCANLQDLCAEAHSAAIHRIEADIAKIGGWSAAPGHGKSLM